MWEIDGGGVELETAAALHCKAEGARAAGAGKGHYYRKRLQRQAKWISRGGQANRLGVFVTVNAVFSEVIGCPPR